MNQVRIKRVLNTGSERWTLLSYQWIFDDSAWETIFKKKSIIYDSLSF